MRYIIVSVLTLLLAGSSAMASATHTITNEKNSQRYTRMTHLSGREIVEITPTPAYVTRGLVWLIDPAFNRITGDAGTGMEYLDQSTNNVNFINWAYDTSFDAVTSDHTVTWDGVADIGTTNIIAATSPLYCTDNFTFQSIMRVTTTGSNRRFFAKFDGDQDPNKNQFAFKVANLTISGITFQISNDGVNTDVLMSSVSEDVLGVSPTDDKGTVYALAYSGGVSINMYTDFARSGTVAMVGTTYAVGSDPVTALNAEDSAIYITYGGYYETGTGPLSMLPHESGPWMLYNVILTADEMDQNRAWLESVTPWSHP